MGTPLKCLLLSYKTVKQKRTFEEFFERCLRANRLRLLTKGILDGYSGYDLSDHEVISHIFDTFLQYTL